mmetsp:Transcript_105783/g.309436  ORF Transcript_105783/g.309436 Transcript_105783/m.309436 type:complete len:231 (+) Transcript_105783:173-865(+)
MCIYPCRCAYSAGNAYGTYSLLEGTQESSVNAMQWHTPRWWSRFRQGDPGLFPEETSSLHAVQRPAVGQEVLRFTPPGMQGRMKPDFRSATMRGIPTLQQCVASGLRTVSLSASLCATSDSQVAGTRSIARVIGLRSQRPVRGLVPPLPDGCSRPLRTTSPLPSGTHQLGARRSCSCPAWRSSPSSRRGWTRRRAWGGPAPPTIGRPQTRCSASSTCCSSRGGRTTRPRR